MLKLEGNLVVPDVWLTYFHTYLLESRSLLEKSIFEAAHKIEALLCDRHPGEGVA